MFDSLTYTEKLKEAGFTKDQAEKSIKLLMEIMDSNLATKTEMNDLQKEINDLRMEMRSSIEKMVSKTDFINFKNDIDKRFSEVDKNFFQIHHRFETLEFKLVVKLGALMIIIQGAFLSLAKYLSL